MSAEESNQGLRGRERSADIRSIIDDDSGNHPFWLTVCAIFFAGMVLLGALDAHRRATIAPSKLLQPPSSLPMVLLLSARTEPFGPLTQPIAQQTVAAENCGAATVFDVTASVAAVILPASSCLAARARP